MCYRLAGLFRREHIGCIDVQDCAWAGWLDGVPHLDGPIQRARGDVALQRRQRLAQLPDAQCFTVSIPLLRNLRSGPVTARP